METTNPFSFIPFYDMAVEAGRFLRGDGNREIPGVSEKVEDNDAFKKTVITIENESGVEALNRPVGTYVTIDSKRSLDDEGQEKEIVSAVAKAVAAMLPKDKSSSILLCGIGNPKIASDSLGSSVLSRMIATRSFSANSREQEHTDDPPRSVALLAPDVLGNTGIESAEIITAVTKAISPDVLLIVDALATSSLSRLGTSVQITDTGLSPGGGIGNQRPAISEKTVHIPVVAIGVPTVIYPHAIISHAFSRLKKEIETKDKTAVSLHWETAEESLYRMLQEKMGLFAVTPKDIDIVIATISKLLAGGIEIALHDEITVDNYKEYLI